MGPSYKFSLTERSHGTINSVYSFISPCHTVNNHGTESSPALISTTFCSFTIHCSYFLFPKSVTFTFRTRYTHQIVFYTYCASNLIPCGFHEHSRSVYYVIFFNTSRSVSEFFRKKSLLNPKK